MKQIYKDSKKKRYLIDYSKLLISLINIHNVPKTKEVIKTRLVLKDIFEKNLQKNIFAPELLQI